jgi:hypothetical protein
MRSNTEFKILLETWENSRFFGINHLLTAQYMSDCEGLLKYTELVDTLIINFDGKNVINTLLNALLIRHESWYGGIVNWLLDNG